MDETKGSTKEWERWLNAYLKKNWEDWKDDIGVSKGEALENFNQSFDEDHMFDAFIGGWKARSSPALKGRVSARRKGKK